MPMERAVARMTGPVLWAMKILLKTFPEHFPSILRPNTATTVKKIWEV